MIYFITECLPKKIISITIQRLSRDSFIVFYFFPAKVVLFIFHIYFLFTPFLFRYLSQNFAVAFSLFSRWRCDPPSVLEVISKVRAQGKERKPQLTNMSSMKKLH